MRHIWGLLVTILLTLFATSASAGDIQLPRLVNPPPPRQQVAEAQIWDPYPMRDVGPYADGTRPRDFLYPPPEATRGRYPAPGTFPRPAPWTRSSAPADYPKLRKWWLRKRAETPPVETPAAAAQPAQPVEIAP